MNDRMRKKIMFHWQSSLLRVVTSAALLLLFATFPLLAQTFRGGLSGTINDDAGAAIPGASVKVISKATGATRNAETGKNGEFVIPEMPLGFYTVEVGKQGFQTTRINDVEVVVSTNTAVNLQLRVAAVTETVEISADTVVWIDTASTALTGIIGPKQVQDLPLNGRDFLQMIQLTPGVAGTSTSINGSRTRGNNYQLTEPTTTTHFRMLRRSIRAACLALPEHCCRLKRLISFLF